MTYSKWPYLAILTILKVISSLLVVQNPFFLDWILITHIEQHQNENSKNSFFTTPYCPCCPQEQFQKCWKSSLFRIEGLFDEVTGSEVADNAVTVWEETDCEETHAQGILNINC